MRSSKRFRHVEDGDEDGGCPRGLRLATAARPLVADADRVESAIAWRDRCETLPPAGVGESANNLRPCSTFSATVPAASLPARRSIPAGRNLRIQTSMPVFFC